jgi:DNA polymerase-1
MRKKLFIIDSMALLFRSFYAFNRTSLSTKDGVPTGAVYGSAMFLNKLIHEEKPDYLVCVTDTPAPTFRHEIYKDYKAHRDEMPTDLRGQVPYFFELLAAFGCPPVSLDGFEADDVIGTLARRYGNKDTDVFIVSGDKDFMQLVNDHVRMYVPKKNEEAVIVGTREVGEKFHCPPEKVIDCLALIGDTADNVPGVPGIGEVTAGKLVHEYGSLDGIYASIDKITAKKQKEALLEHKDQAYLSRRLVTINTEAPLDFELETFRTGENAAASARLLDFYQRMEFKSLVKKIAVPAAGKTSRSSTGEPATPLAEPDSPVETHAHTDQELDQIIAACDGRTTLFVRADYSGSDIFADRPTKICLLTSEHLVILPSDERGIYFARRFLRKAGPLKVVHDLKMATHMFRNIGIDIVGPVFDPEIADYLIDPNNYDHSLASIAYRYAHITLPDDSSAEGVVRYVPELVSVLAEEIKKRELSPVMNEIDLPLAPVLADMERLGVYVDGEFLAAYSDELNSKLAEAERKVYKAVGEEFNINSPKQLQEILFNKLRIHEQLGIKNLKKTKTGFSTDESVLTKMAGHPVPQLILDYRTIAKIKSTYVDTLPQYTNPLSGRVHTTFRQTVAATGRLSSDKPNLQNIPMRTALGREIRKAFRPKDPDWIIISADYSQIEIRLLAHMAGDEDLITAFREGLDIHTVTAAKIFNLPPGNVDPVYRSRAKAINFGIIYGMGPLRLSQETGVTLPEAKAFIQKYFEVYPGIQRMTNDLIDSAHKLGYCKTLFGRRRPIPELKDSNQGIRVRGENIAVNAPIQGTSADLIKIAMIHIHDALRERRMQTRMILQVHDELVFTGPKAEKNQAMALIQEKMEHAMETKVPLKVEINSGANWLEAH